MNRYYKEIEEFKGYYISKNGSVYSKKSNKRIKHNGKYVCLWKDSKKYMRSISKILETTFYKIITNNDDIKNFKLIKGFENYLIDENGNVYSNKIKRIKKTFTNPYGYKCIFLFKNGKSHNKLIHRLVYETWKGDIPEKITVDHIDENKNNNNIINLQLLTRSENVLKFHKLRGRNRHIEGYIKIEGYENYYINEKGNIISFKYGENYHSLSIDRGGVHLMKNNKRYYVTVSYLQYKYFGIGKICDKKYSNVD